MEKLKRFVEAMVFIYIPWWLTCSSSSSAPIHDLSLLMDMNSWGDQVVKEAGLIAFRRHLWYLSAENIPRALFSDLVSMETKDKMATRLLEFETTDKPQKQIVRIEELIGKPDFPQIENIVNLVLEDFVNQDSWFFSSLSR